MSAAERLEHAERLDGAAAVAEGLVRRVLPPGPRSDVLHGVPLGQPAHPALAGLPLGFWTSAAVLDLVPGSARASRTLIALGLAAAVPAAAAGWVDWSELHREQQRVGLVHAASGACASVLFAGSLLARMTGRTASGRALTLGGLAAATAGGSSASSWPSRWRRRQPRRAGHPPGPARLARPVQGQRPAAGPAGAAAARLPDAGRGPAPGRDLRS